MEKLIELLNYYNRNVLKHSDVWELKDSKDNPGTKYISLSSVGAWKIYLWIISREYGFIKRLIDNDKIKLWSDKIRECGDAWTEYRCNTYENILINLALSDEPIKFLTEILK